MLEKFERLQASMKLSYANDAKIRKPVMLMRLGEADKGIEVMKKISSDKSYRPHYVWGRLLAEAGKLDEAEAELEKACKQRADSTEAREELARVLMKQNKADEAIVIFNEILQLDPDNYLAWHNKANALAKKVLWKEAASAYREAVRLSPISTGAGTTWRWRWMNQETGRQL